VFVKTLGMRLRGAYLTFHRRANAHFEPNGMTADQFVVLSILAEEEGLSQRAIVDRAFSDPNTIAAILRRLEDKELLRREEHPDDGRARCVYLTPQGRKLQEQLALGAEGLLKDLDELFSAEERATLCALLGRIPSAMTAARRSAAGERR
jgi:DNA-binding MarR family transcriptional regulator